MSDIQQRKQDRMKQIEEKAYDEIMSEARKIFQKRWNEYNDAYAFHKAFEYAQKKIVEYKNTHHKVRFVVTDKRSKKESKPSKP